MYTAPSGAVSLGVPHNMQFPHQLFKTAGLNSTDVANLCGVSRITGYRWLQGINRKNGTEGVGVNLFLRDRVTDLAAPLKEAVADGALPDPVAAKLSPPKRAEYLRTIINQYRSNK